MLYKILYITVYIEMYSTVNNALYCKVYSILFGTVHEFIPINIRWQGGGGIPQKIFQLGSHLVSVHFVVY